ncbi:MAG TPA: hypothetical protein VIV66_08300 [Pyrinomonadaceae bacterium]
MSMRISLLAAALLIISSAVSVSAQTTTTTVTQTPTTVTKTVENADGTYTVIEYPVGKEVQLTLTPVSLTKSKAVGTILRDDTGTKVILNLTDIPAEVSAINVYAVDDAGVVTSLGPVVLANGAGKFTATTPLSKFMLIAAPDESLTAYDPNAKIYFRSAVPKGFTVIPQTTAAAAITTPPAVTTTPPAVTTTPPAVTTTPPAVTTTPPAVTTTPTVVTSTPTAITTTPTAVTSTPPAVTTTPTAVTTTPTAVTTTSTTVTTAPVGETVSATAGPVTDDTAAVTVPMLNIPAYKKGDDTKLNVNFTGAMSGARANVFIEPHKDKATDVKMRFHELKDAPKGQAYILWAVSPDGQFVKLGQIVNIKDRNEAEINAQTTLPDFGLLITMEDIGVVKNVVVKPAGLRLGVIEIIK